MRTLVDLLRESADRHGDRPALVAHTGLRADIWSRRDLWRAANAVGRHLRDERGLAPGTPVVFWEPNSPALAAAFFGTMAARLVLVPIDPTATQDFVERVVALTGAGLVVATSAAGTDLGAPRVALGDLPVGRAVGSDDRPQPDAPAPDDVAEIVFTSGTTGQPKGVVLLHRNITANVDAALALFPDRPFHFVSLLPLSHMFEQTAGLYGPLQMGSTVHYPSSRRAPVIAKTIRRNRIEGMIAVPQVLDLMLRDIEHEVTAADRERQWRLAHRLARVLPFRARRVLFFQVHRSLGGHLRYVMVGGAHLPVELAAAWERMGVRVVEGYGATECSPIVAANTYWERHHGSVGRPVAGVEVRIADDAEVLVRGPNVFAGYWGAPEATAAVLDDGGWFHTGDLGAIDDDGHVFVTGRRTDRIVLASGLNVFPEDVESELRAEPEIEECVVVSVPDDHGNAHVRAAVIPATGAGGRPLESSVVEDAVRRAAGRLAPHQRPTGWTIWTQREFPRTNLMKVKRYEVEAAMRSDRPPTTPGVAQAEVSDVDRLHAVVARIAGVDVGEVHPSSDLSLDLGIDSLAKLELAVALETELGVVVDEGDLADVATVGALAERVDRPAVAGVAPPTSTWPQERWAGVLRAAVQRAVLLPIHRCVARPFVVEGQQTLDGLAGPVLVIANHCSHLDTPSILRAMSPEHRRRTAVAAAADYFYRSRPVGATASLVLGTFPFSREGAVRSSLERCGELVDDGWSIVVYPEGTRSTTGETAAFRRGIGLLATQLGVPIVPVGIVGTHDVWPKGRRLPRPGPVVVRFGRPIEIARDEDPVVAVARLERAVVDLVAAVGAPGGGSGGSPGRPDRVVGRRRGNVGGTDGRRRAASMVGARRGRATVGVRGGRRRRGPRPGDPAPSR